MARASAKRERGRHLVNVAEHLVGEARCRRQNHPAAHRQEQRECTPSVAVIARRRTSDRRPKRSACRNMILAASPRRESRPPSRHAAAVRSGWFQGPSSHTWCIRPNARRPRRNDQQGPPRGAACMPGSSAVFATCALALFQIPAPAYWEFTFADSLFTERYKPELACCYCETSGGKSMRCSRAALGLLGLNVTVAVWVRVSTEIQNRKPRSWLCRCKTMR